MGGLTDRAGRCLFVLAIGTAVPRVVQAQVDVEALPPITDTNYAIDLYQGAALGSGRIIGMGGAAVANAEGSAGMLANPASAAIRPATDNDKWSWDWHLDWLSPEIGKDFDNNGIETTDDLTITPFFTLGLVGKYKRWALGVSGSFVTFGHGEVESTFTVAQIILARSFWQDKLTVGIGSRIGTFGVKENDNGAQLFEISGSALEVGAVWRPSDQDLRVGATISFPVTDTQPSYEGCDPMDCNGLILPGNVRVPWRVATGVAYRFGPTAWNRKIAGAWRDEKSVLIAADLVITGAVENGYGVEAFANRNAMGPDQRLQQSGRTTVLSVRAGAEYEWLPGRLRLRGGSYWEPGRFRDHLGATVPGRTHGTFGLDLRIYRFCFWGDRYRVRMSLTGDGADSYFNGGVSVGLWH